MEIHEPGGEESDGGGGSRHEQKQSPGAQCWGGAPRYPGVGQVNDKPRQHIKKQRHHFANKGPSSQGYGFSNSHVWM